MRKADRDRDMVLPPSTVNELVHKYRLPLSPCLPYLHKKFRDKKFIGSTNYEHVMKFLNKMRRERHKIGPEEIQDWRDQLGDDDDDAEEELGKSVSKEEEELVQQLKSISSKTVLDIEMLENRFIEKSSFHSKNHVHFKDLAGCFKSVGVEIETKLLEQLQQLTSVKKNYSSIPAIIKILKKLHVPVDDDVKGCGIH